MVNLLFVEDDEVLTKPGVVRTIYDPTAGRRELQQCQDRRSVKWSNPDRRCDRGVIDAPEASEIRDTTDYEVLISEFDFKNRSCKFSLRDQDDPSHRFNGEITDPVAQAPQNPYSKALNDQRWLWVKAKAQLKEGELEKLYISDLATRALPAPA